MLPSLPLSLSDSLKKKNIFWARQWENFSLNSDFWLICAIFWFNTNKLWVSGCHDRREYTRIWISGNSKFTHTKAKWERKIGNKLKWLAINRLSRWEIFVEKSQITISSFELRKLTNTFKRPNQTATPDYIKTKKIIRGILKIFFSRSEKNYLRQRTKKVD